MTTAPEPVKVDTEYVVLVFTSSGEGDGRAWEEFARVTGRDHTAAIRAAIEKVGDYDGGTYVAVPFRSWKPVKVTPRVETTLDFNPVKP